MVEGEVAISDFFFRIDNQSVVTDYHGRLSSQDVLGKRFHDVFPVPLAEPLYQAISQISQSGKARAFEYSERIKDQERTFEVIITPLVDNEFLVMVRNVTEVRKANLALQTSKERFDLAAEAVKGTIYDWDIEDSRIVWTRGLTDVFGFPPDQLETTDQWWVDHVHPADRQQVLDLISRQLDESNDFVIEYRFRDANNQYRIVVDRGRLIRDASGRVNRVVGSMSDVTVERHAEVAIRESEKRYRGLVETMHEFVSEIKLDGTVRFVNQPFLNATGYDREELIGENFFSFVHPDDVAPTMEHCRTLTEKALPVRSCEYRFRSKDRTYLNLLTNADPLHDADGNMNAILQVSFDITERKRAEDSLHLLLEVISTASEADDARSVASRCLETICYLGKWELGQAWFLDPKENSLSCSHSFYSSLDAGEFRGESLRLRFPPGVELPGRVWRNNSPLWIMDVAAELNSPRASLAKEIGLKTAVAFPICTWDKLLAIFELFTTESRPPDEHLLAAVDKLGSHLAVVFERKQEQDRIRHQAYHDVLTGLPNRILLEDRFSQALAHARRNNLMLAVLFLDLDEFKAINDRLGHHMGDHLLRGVAQRLSKCLREFDTVARLGGDEFMVLLPDVENIQDAAKVAQKILLSFDSPFTVGEHELHTSTSIGISLYPHDGEDLQSLMKNADIALYRAKEKGRNNYQLYTPTMTVASLARMRMEKDLRYAVERNELLLHYQPQLNIQTGKIMAVEALLRWQHPDMGLFLPAEFLPIAEETGLIFPIWKWALETACSQKRTWRDSGIHFPCIAMNITALQFQQNNLRQLITDILKKTRLEPEDLELEVTESMTTSREISISVLNELREIGVRLAMDDFGTGSSSLTHLKKFPVDTLKMDHYLIRGLATDPADMAIAVAVVSLGHGMGMTVVAEGVETKEQLMALRSIDCDGIQGFLICRPLPKEPLTALLAQGLKLPF